MRTNRAASEGFTLLEILIVILIIGLLTGIVGPRLMSHIGKSEVTTARAQIDAFTKALGAYRLDMGQYPTQQQGLRALVEAPAGDSRWRGPYLGGAIPKDPWGQDYIYRNPGSQGREFEVISYGRDRSPGGQQDDADVVGH